MALSIEDTNCPSNDELSSQIDDIYIWLNQMAESYNKNIERLQILSQKIDSFLENKPNDFKDSVQTNNNKIEVLEKRMMNLEHDIDVKSIIKQSIKELIQETRGITCCLCGKHTDTPIWHHISYFPERTMLICYSCNNRKFLEINYPQLCPSIEDAKRFYQKG